MPRSTISTVARAQQTSRARPCSPSPAASTATSARITNHHWVISRAATQQALGLDHLRLVNDFAAQAMAVELLTDDDLVTIGDAHLDAALLG